MKTIKIIKSIIGLTAILMIVGVVLAIVVIVTLPEGEYVYVPIGEPHLEITSEDIRSSIQEVLPSLDGRALIEANILDLSMPINLKLKIIIICLILTVSIYIGFAIEITRRIILDVEKKIPFTISNIRRVKLIGTLVAIAPIFEWLLRMIFANSISADLLLTNLKLRYESGLGWPVFLLGLLFIVLGIAFEQGKKLQEENELTI